MVKMTKTEQNEAENIERQAAVPPASVPAVVASASAAQPPVPVERTGPAAPHGLPVTAFANLATAVTAITKGIAEDRPVKSGENTFHRYKYAPMQEILQKLTPLLAKNGITIMQSEVERGVTQDGQMVYATYEFTIIHSSGEVWPQKQRQTGTCRAKDSKGGFDDKAMNKCHTQARKYFLLALFQIPTEDEDDADRGDNDGTRAPRRPAPEAHAPERAPVVKVAPMVLPTHDADNKPLKFVVWAGPFVEQINLATSKAEIEQWEKCNAVALDAIRGAENSKKLADRIDAVIADRIAEIAART